MQCFNDKTGRQWTIDINLGTARRVKAECGIDLLNVVETGENGVKTDVLQTLADDAYVLLSVLFSLCKGQLEEKNVSEESFAESFDADVIQNAVDALIKEIINFSQPLKRKMLAIIYQKTQSFKKKAEKHLDSLMESKEFDNAIDEQLNSLLTSSQE